ncbi:hypothetical protein HHK36_025679 [Tetracentron sinense]|uniref:Transcription repressor n=1 Tax=Tetracentron sinense TaxID=13715 RepID=A0A834YHC1_TETSI|nr:hypothetical protein HHK36_025679 [Tetracentron sinense]
MAKRLQRYLSKLKNPTPQSQIPPISYSSTSSILSGCENPRTPSLSRNRNQDVATLSDIDQFLYDNFSSLYRKNDDDDRKNKDDDDDAENPTGFLFESPRFVDLPPDLRASLRFFVSPGLSNSLIEEHRLSASTSEDLGSNCTTDQVKGLTLPENSVAVLTNSSEPYEDFRRSMEEMVEARLQNDETVDWDFMEELLFCYLKLNEKKSYKYVLSAYVDLMVVLRQNSGATPAKSRKIPVTRERRRRKGGVSVTQDVDPPPDGS